MKFKRKIPQTIRRVPKTATTEKAYREIALVINTDDRHFFTANIYSGKFLLEIILNAIGHFYTLDTICISFRTHSETKLIKKFQK